ncbi:MULTISPECIES: hypothetical protein [unclassified Moraxella]|uniref:hypothetical protein n=1 Tax=unclassified Moraxella TaxID=2685852 RepID=UPI003AF5ECE7
MPFSGLLIILSLVIVIPLWFIVRAKRQPTAQFQPNPLNPNHLSQASTEQPPVIALGKLPNLFQQIITDIEAQFAEIVRKDQASLIDKDSFFTAKRLFYTRLPEMVNDYLKLDPHYATAEIIDKAQHLTSYDLVQKQLKAILNVFIQINQSSNQQQLQHILGNQRYLQAVYQQTGLVQNNELLSVITTNTNSPTVQLDSLNLSADLTKNSTTNTTNQLLDSDWQAGYQYLHQYLPQVHNPQSVKFSQSFVSLVGQLVYIASITQQATKQELGKGLNKLHIQADLQLEALANLLAYQLPQSLQQAHALPSDTVINYENTTRLLIQQLLEILHNLLATLDKPLPIADKLALVQNLHDDLADLVEQQL